MLNTFQMQQEVKSLNLGTLKHKLMVDDCNIVFFGASVTQQGAPSSYVQNIKDILKLHDEFSNFNVKQLGFGSLHLKDAILLLDEVIVPLHKKQPIHICFLQWLTDVSTEIKDLEYLVCKLLKLGIFPAFLLFYNDNNRVEREKVKNIFYRIAGEYELPLIDLDSYFDGSPLFNKELFRDNTHLTILGSTIVANLLFDTIFYKFNTFLNKVGRIINHKIIFVPFKRYYVEEHKENKPYLPLFKSTENPYIPILAHAIKIGEVITLPKTEGIIIGIWCITGREAGIVEIKSEDDSEKINIFDEWSHFDRFTIRRFSKEWNTDKGLTLSLTNDEPDHSNCRRSIKEWPIDRVLWILGWSLLIE